MIRTPDAGRRPRLKPLIAACLASCAVGAQAGDLRNFISDLYGGDGITLDRFGQFPHDAHFTDASLQALNALGDGITSGLGSLSLNSAVSGYTFDVQQGIPVQTTESLGPLVAERADTQGAGKVTVGMSPVKRRALRRSPRISISTSRPSSIRSTGRKPFATDVLA